MNLWQPTLGSVKCTSRYRIKLLNSTFFCLYDESDIVLHVAVIVVIIDHTEAVGEDPHLHGSVSAAGEDVASWPHLDLHDTRAEVSEQRLAGMFVRKGVEETLCDQAPNLF